jgi:uncharacterized protein YqgC (DUF456 family)
MTTLGIALFALLALVGLVLTPLGLPGLWVIVAGVLTYGWLTEFRTVSVGIIALVVGLAFLGELLEYWVGFRYTRIYGGSKSAGWGALLGGIAGAIVGMPVPVLGSVIGAFAGSFVGAVAFEWLHSRQGPTAVRAGWGALAGRAVSAAVKTALGLVIAVVGVFAMLR